MSFSVLRNQVRQLKLNRRVATTFDLVLGPCAIESVGQLEECARVAKAVGATFLRGGAIKLRTRHGSFEGLGGTAWGTLSEIARANGLRAVSEVTTASDIDIASQNLDAIQIGARCMWNFDLLRAAAASHRTVVLKRGMGASTHEWLAAAERLQAYGCNDVVLCERGGRGNEPASRNAIDISVLAFLTDEVPLPVWLDVSHSAGDPEVALSLLQRARSFGLSGAMAEIHPNPAQALCDGDQAIPTAKLTAFDLKVP
jgi:3-deoxy-7-phosphoheptulonate synthase